MTSGDGVVVDVGVGEGVGAATALVGVGVALGAGAVELATEVSVTDPGGVARDWIKVGLIGTCGVGETSKTVGVNAVADNVGVWSEPSVFAGVAPGSAMVGVAEPVMGAVCATTATLVAGCWRRYAVATMPKPPSTSADSNAINPINTVISIGVRRTLGDTLRDMNQP
jgi:hypothetical protein